MDHDNRKVFVTGIRRKLITVKNNLREITQKDVAQPLAPQNKDDQVQDVSCDFMPSIGKVYIPKKKSKLKVLTVRDLRTKYEEDILLTLPNELEKQQKLLLRKIKHGFVKDENTKSIALNLLRSNNPISRLSWQMLMNINPEGHTQFCQFILCDGKCIRVNGSKGGKNKFICNYDVGKGRKVDRRTITTKSKLLTKKRSLLQASLNIRFKPGPLSQKKNLDYSYQKHHVGETELVKLPSPSLRIKPSYGTPLEPTIKTFVQNLREEDGTISAKWAEFAASMVGKVTNSGIQLADENLVTFDLNYKYNQKHILMRHDVDTFQNVVNDNLTTEVFSPCTMNDELTLTSEVSDVINRIVDSVEINLSQELMYPTFDEPREMSINSKRETSTQIKEKGKRRYGELDRLDVTVIRLSERQKKNNTEPCGQLFCALGCICNSLECNYNLKEHCGRVDCMLKCKCDFSNYKFTNSLNDDCSQLYHGLYYLDKKIHGKLTKEEQKFHQTVILTEDKSILLKSNRRNWKATKKYADFYSSMRLRSEIKNKKILSVVVTKLNCPNIEPWCMVHNLYKCFCKGKFTESLIYDLPKNDQHTHNGVDNEKEVLPVPDVLDKVSHKTDVTDRSDRRSNTINDAIDSSVYVCSRVQPYRGRKHSGKYYRKTNKMIIEMEENDVRLHAKMINMIKQSNGTEAEEGNRVNKVVDVATPPFKIDDLLLNILQEQQKLMDSMNSENNEAHGSQNIDIREMQRLTNRTKLVQWLESSYKTYKKRLSKGLWNKSLSPPRCGKVSLYPWNFILSRFRERKNLFLISSQKPFRIFMAVDTNHPYFKKCVNVNDISPSHLIEYPEMVHKLINNETDENDAFCILNGLTHCWELVGSVTKLNENEGIKSDSNAIEEHSKDLEGEIKSNSNAIEEHSKDLEGGIKSDSNAIEEHSKDLEGVIKSNSNAIEEHYKDLEGRIKSNSNAIEEHSKDLEGGMKYNSNAIEEHSKDLEGGIKSDSNAIEEHSKDSVYSSNNETSLESVSIELDTDRDLSDQTNKQESKWFVMTIENDFTELQFFIKGFFIKYDSIVRAIVVSRKFCKTVKLSSQQCNAGDTDPQFGLYAIPNMNDNCVFIGPYEKDEPLGLEALRNPVDVLNINKTRGKWITVNKIDNREVIKNPLSFMPLFDKGSYELITFENDTPAEPSLNIEPSTSSVENVKIGMDSTVKDLMKSMNIVEPLKIAKTGAFKLPLKILAKPLPYSCIKKRKKVEVRKTSSDSCLQIETVGLSKGTDTSMLEEFNEPEYHEPVDESQPNIKITNVASLCGVESLAGNATMGAKPEKGMFVLKPEEINKRLALNYFRVLQPDEINQNNDDIESITDVQNSLDSNAKRSPKMTEVYVISDDEDSNSPCPKRCNEVWISCTNIKNLGWIPGMRNNENKLSFIFPGFASTDFYDEEVAFTKINQVISRKVYIPKNITLKWKVIDKEEDINMEDELNLNYLSTDFVLTKRGLVHKNSLVYRGRKRSNEDNNSFGYKRKKVDVNNTIDLIEVGDDIVHDINNKVGKEGSISSYTGEDDVFGDKKTDEDVSEFKDEQTNECNNVFGDIIEIHEDSVFDDENIINYKNVLGDEERKDKDNNLFGDEEEINEDCKVPALSSKISITKSTSTRLKKTSTNISKKDVFERDSAD